MTINERAKAEGFEIIRLKLGGDQIPGWLHVENYAEPLDATPGSIDQILCTGVVQTMPRWLVVNLLRDWYDKLRVQGLLAIEMPDLDKAILLRERQSAGDLIATPWATSTSGNGRCTATNGKAVSATSMSGMSASSCRN